MEYKLIVNGSRDFDDYTLLKVTLNEVIASLKSKGFSPTIVSGTARGADRLGERYANEHGVNLLRVPANWKEFPKRAGYMRNQQMVDMSQGLVSFWDSASSGTKHTIDIAHKHNLHVKVVEYATNRLVTVKGDLLHSDCTFIAHQANCQSVMGAGIAKSLVAMYPQVRTVDVNYPGTPEQRLGECSRVFVDDKKRVVANLYGQLHYGRGVRTDYNALKSALTTALKGADVLEKSGFPVKFGVPFGMGCGLAGGDWKLVTEILNALAQDFNRTIYLYKIA